MKNIHLLPTDKPSRLGYLTKKGKEVFNDLRLFEKPMPNILDSENQNIYITSDEEIKEGWKGYAYKEDVTGKVFKHFYTTNEWYKDAKKIILTTDQDLIKDGVQAIDDKFLEWFVKNPSCESVEIKTFCCQEISKNYCDLRCGKQTYKIIIPKEEPNYNMKQEIISEMERLDEEQKQETLERAAEKFRSENPGTMQGGNNTKILNAFKNGAKWQQERMYSEEEVRRIASKAFLIKSNNSTLLEDFDKWFQQFQKK